MYIIALCLLLGVGAISAQQLDGGNMFMTYAGLSPSCQSALNTSVSCPIALSFLSQSDAYLDQDSVDVLCKDSCLSSLQNAKAVIAKACTTQTDIIVLDDIAYPATFFADSYIQSYELACRRDSSTGLYCDPQLLSWSNSSFGASQSCSDCWLGGLALKLSSPLGYDGDLGSNFASLTSLCSASQYSFATPTRYALNATDTGVPTPTSVAPPPGCTGSHTVDSSENCTSLSETLSVSTYNLLYYNSLDIYCQNFDAIVGKTVCIPPTCALYTWQPSDTCNSVVSQHTGMTVSQFLSWNPNLNSLCQNSGAFIGYKFCIGPPGGSINSTTPSNHSASGIATAPAPVPTNARDGSNRNCGRWYTIMSGDTCGLVSVAYSISLDDFNFLNPSLDADCTNLLLGIAYCVEPVGDIHQYPHYTFSDTNLPITVPPATFDPVDTSIPSPTSDPGYDYTTSQLPVASGTSSNCTAYQNQDAGSAHGDCDYVAFAHQISTDQLMQWNPSLSRNISSCVLAPGYSYCVAMPNSGEPPPNYCAPVQSSMIKQGTTPDCKCFVVVHGYDKGYYSCQGIETDYSITEEEFFTWNKWLPTSCDDNLYANLDTYDARAVCVGLNGSAPVTTTTTSQQVSTPSTSSPTMGPTPSGIVQDCQQFYTVQSGDSCTSIESAYKLSFSQFYSWNPSIGSNCENLWLGYAYCVKGPASTSTSVQPPAPTQSGVASNCNKYHTVESGDGCAQIETLYNITFAQLYKWNPAIGSNCENLWLGYAVCVGVAS